jgi:hypothetical protein
MTYAQYLKVSFEELYKRYDESSDETEKALIKRAVEHKDPPNRDPHFTPYPQHNHPEFQKILFEKKEFNSHQLFLDSTHSEHQCGGDFSIKPHQIVLQNFMNKESPYHSLLVYHGVGVGKTCSGLTIAENFRDTYARKDRRILILCSKNIQIGWKNTIYTPERGSNQCTGDSFTSTDAKTPRQVNKLIKQYYEIMAYQSFSNFVKRKQEDYCRSLPDDEREEGKVRWIREYFSDRLVIIDEAHNIRDDQGKDMRDAVKTVEDVIKYSRDMRLLLLTATPMYNRATEILWMINMMLLNDGKTPIDHKTVFDTQGGLTEEGRVLLDTKSKGYVSYLRGENPITFPLRLTPKYLRKSTGELMFPLYSKNHENSILYKKKTPSLNLVGGSIAPADRFTFLELFGSKLTGLQTLIYEQAIENMVAADPEIDLDERGEKNSILDNVLLTQITNCVFPVGFDSKDIKNLTTIKQDLRDGTIQVEDFYGARGLQNTMNRRGQSFTYKTPTLPFFDKDFIKDYSCKLASVLDAVDNSEGIIFIYTNYVDSGIIPLQLMLEHNGYKRYDKRKVISFPEYKSSSHKHKCKREPMSYHGMNKTDAGDDFKQATFMVIDGSTNKKELAEQLHVVTSSNNSEGQKIKIILGTVVASEGLDFKRIRSIHILDPWLHLNRIEQTVGRGIRFCSHADLPETKQNVLTYLHTSTLASDRETIDTSIYRYAEKKSLQIGLVETILKQNAIDRYLYEDINVIGKGSLQNVSVKPSIYHAKQISVDPTDKAYSKVCSYMPDCDYNSDITVHYDIDLDTDTFRDTYSKHAIQNIKQRIALLYREYYVFRLESIVGLMSEYGFIYDDMIYQALSEMISEKYTLYSPVSASGYILNRGTYYLFQPFLYEDEYLPLQYRCHLQERKATTIKLDRINEIIETPTYSQSYTYASILNIYNDSVPDIIDETCVTLIDVLAEQYTELTAFHPAVLGYIYDRLSFSDKCGIVYAYLQYPHIPESTYHEELKPLIQQNIIYVSDDGSYYFGAEYEHYQGLHVFGCYLTFRNKVYYYEYYDELIQPCDKVQITAIETGLRRYIQSALGKSFKKHSSLWGYAINRVKHKQLETVFKFVAPGTKDMKHPTGPGNVCLENNLGSSKEKIKELIVKFLPELEELLTPFLIKKKKGEPGKDSNKHLLCFLLELAMRYSPTLTFYPLDQWWIKYI